MAKVGSVLALPCVTAQALLSSRVCPSVIRSNIRPENPFSRTPSSGLTGQILFKGSCPHYLQFFFFFKILNFEFLRFFFVNMGASYGSTNNISEITRQNSSPKYQQLLTDWNLKGWILGSFLSFFLFFSFPLTWMGSYGIKSFKRHLVW